MSLERACIELLDRASSGGSNGEPSSFTVMFNPEKVTATKSTQYAEVPIPGRDVPILQYVRGQSETFTLDLFLDSTLDGFNPPTNSVEEHVRFIGSLLNVQPKFKAPPRIRFTWGVGLTFDAVVQQVRREYTMFAGSGTPVRATLSVTFRGIETPEESKRNDNAGTGRQQQGTIAQEGQTASSMAAERLGNAKDWRKIANANPDMDPMDPTPGDAVQIPAATGAGGS